MKMGHHHNSSWINLQRFQDFPFSLFSIQLLGRRIFRVPRAFNGFPNPEERLEFSKKGFHPALKILSGETGAHYSGWLLRIPNDTKAITLNSLSHFPRKEGRRKKERKVPGIIKKQDTNSVSLSFFPETPEDNAQDLSENKMQLPAPRWNFSNNEEEDEKGFEQTTATLQWKFNIK